MTTISTNNHQGAVPLIGRILLAVIFILSGVSKLANPAGTQGYIASVGLPLPLLAYIAAVVVEIGGGVMLLLGYRFDTAWFAAVVVLFVLTGACWIPVVFIQYRLRDLAISATSFEALPQEFHRLMRRWIALGVPAFSSVLLIVVLMVTRAGVATSLSVGAPTH